MHRLIRTLAVLVLCVSWFCFFVRPKRQPLPLTKAPTTRYHGYALNRTAIAKAKTFTVLISSEGFGHLGRGTGVLIDATHVLTCAHVAEGPDADLWIFPYPGGAVAKGKPVFVNPHLDLAILELDTAINIPQYATFQDNHYDGEPITIIGNTMGSMKWFVTFGIISGEWDNFLLTDGVLYGGNSGGPWINENGDVVALTDWTLVYKGKESDIHGGVPAKDIRAFLKRWKAPSISDVLQMMMGG